MKLNLVKFKDNTFGVTRKVTPMSSTYFLDASSYSWWPSMSDVVARYCKFKTQEEAEAASLRSDISYTVIK